MASNAKAYAKQLLGILGRDLPVLQSIEDYARGIQDKPYVPDESTAEYRMLTKRCVTNVIPLLENAPSQALYVDGFRPGRRTEGEDGTPTPLADSPEWKHWQRSKLDGRQIAIHRGAIRFGHSFSVTEKTGKGVLTRGLSALKTSALYEDPANDLDPIAALTILHRATNDTEGRVVLGRAVLWDETFRYEVTFDSLTDDATVRIGAGVRHGSSRCPVTRFTASVDLDGNTIGVVYPMMALQDRINQTIFDLLVAQTFSSTNVRWATGMAPPLQRDPVTNDIITDEAGQPIPVKMNYNASRMLFGEDPDTKFGSLPGSPLGGFIEAVDMAFRHLSAISQTPPHHLLGQIANLSAEALAAAEIALQRKVQEFRTLFGESWERVFRIAAELDGVDQSAEDDSGEVIWRDMEQRSIAQAADALGKLREQLQIPARGLWARVPGATQTEIARWEELYDDDPQVQLSDSLRRSTAIAPAFSDAA